MIISVLCKLYSISCYVLLIQFYGVGCEFDQTEEQWILLTKPQQFLTASKKNLLTRTSISRSTIHKDINNKHFGKLFTAAPYLHEHFENDNAKNVSFETTQKILTDANKTDDGIHCLWCFTDRGYMSDDKCYSGKINTKVRCSEAEICYTELHPQYIKRGCLMANKMNRTFVCNCPLCNDKPADDPVYYQYKKIGDWDYHNKRVQIPIVGMQLICKVCDTRGLNRNSDNTCKYGKNADYMVCGRNQVCYVNIDEETDFVSRGCISTPAYNSMFYFCNMSLCNSKPFYIPKIRSEKLLLNDLTPTSNVLPNNTSSMMKFQSAFSILLFIVAVFSIINFNWSLS